MNPEYLKSILCPLCKQALQYDATAQELICEHDQLAFPIKDGIPVMLKEEARSLATQATTETSPENTQGNDTAANS